MVKEITYAKRTERLEASAIRNKLFDQPDIITFSAGKPEGKGFPKDELSKVAMDVLQNFGEKALQYSDTEGLPELRELIAQNRMKAWGVDAGADDIMVVSGSQEAIEMSGKIFCDPGSKVIVENPSYLGAYTALKIYYPEFITVDMDSDGMKMDELENVLKANPDVRFIYTIPDFQNPTGCCMSVERRRKMAELAAQYHVLILEDRPYGDLVYEGKPLPAIKSFDKEGWVITLGSFSKILCPGFRVAWICASPDILKKYNMVKQGSNLQCSTLDEAIIIEYLKRYDLQAHIDDLNVMYGKRRNALISAMETYLPEGIEFNRPNGGFFTWLTLREDIDTAKLQLEIAEKARVAFIPGEPFYAHRDVHNNIRLNFSFIDEAKIEEGMKRFGNYLKVTYYK